MYHQHYGIRLDEYQVGERGDHALTCGQICLKKTSCVYKVLAFKGVALITSKSAKVKFEFWNGLEYTFDSEICRALYFVSFIGVAVAN